MPRVVVVDSQDREDHWLVEEIPVQPRVPDEVLHPFYLVKILIIRCIDTNDMIFKIVVIILPSWTDL